MNGMIDPRGQTIDREEFSDLYRVIKTVYGTDDMTDKQADEMIELLWSVTEKIDAILEALNKIHNSVADTRPPLPPLPPGGPPPLPPFEPNLPPPRET